VILLHITKRELISNLQSLRFAFILIITIALFTMNGLIFSGTYEEKLSDYSRNAADHRESRARDLAFGALYADKRPNPLSFCVEGGESELPAVLSIETNGVIKPDLSFALGERNFTLPRFEEIDWAFIVKILFSLFAIILTYDAISGEKERGTLALMLSNSIQRISILGAKYLAALITILIPLLAGVLLGLLLCFRGGLVALDGQSLGRIGVFALMSIAYISLMILLGLFISSLTQRSSISLLLLLSIWVFFVIVIPGLSSVLAEQFSRVPGEFEFGKQREQIMYFWGKQELGKRIKAKGYHPTDQNEPSEEMEREALRVINEMGEQVFRLTEEYERSIQAQALMAANLGRISPSEVFQHTGEAITDQGLSRQWRFRRAAESYYREWRSYIQEKGGTLVKYPDRGYSQLGFQRIELDGKMVNVPIPFLLPRVDMSDAPIFSEPEVTIVSGFREGIFDTFILFLWNLVLLLMAHAVFMKYDVR
jgi:ABC-type transport system involved in multi-copper enzyme maturation permease subunit